MVICGVLEVDEGDGSNLDRIGMVVYDLIMWKDVAKSSLWFGLGCLCFLSSCFAKGMNFRCVSLFYTSCVSNIRFVVSLRYLNLVIFMLYSILSAISQLGLLVLGASFCSNSICQRYMPPMILHKIMFMFQFIKIICSEFLEFYNVITETMLKRHENLS